jgi:hypothetical protein
MAIRKVISRTIQDSTGVDIVNDSSAPARNSVRPSLFLDFANSRTLDPRITFTRGSTGTYYDGTTALAEQNLFTYSQDFSSADWTKQSVGQSVTADSVAAPDGTTTADTLIENSSGSNTPRWYQSKTIVGSLAGSTYTISCYLKANTRTFGYLQLESQSVGYVIQYFNLSTGATSTLTTSGSSSNVSSSITSVGSGWYRCTLTATFPSGTTLYAFIGIADSTPAAGYTTNGSSIYAWGAQLEQRSSVTAYTATTSSAINNYIPVLKSAGINQPRFDVDPVTQESKGLLIEEQRTNLLTYSTNMSSGWTPSQVTLSTNAAIAPDGTLTATRMIENTAADTHQTYQVKAIASSEPYTFSVYAKAYGNRSIILLSLYTDSGVTNVGRNFDLSNGTIGTNYSTAPTNSTITPVGNGWYRCSISHFVTGATNLYPILRLRNAAGNDAYSGDTYSGLLIWGAQLETGTFATSYIPTTSASATRSQDIPVIVGPNFYSWYNPMESTIIGEGYSNTGTTTVSANPALLSIDDGTGNNRAILRRNQQPTNGTQGGFTYRLVVNGASIQDSFPLQSVQPLWNNSAKHKTAFAFSGTSQEGAGDGSLAGMTSVTYNSFGAPTQMSIGTGASSAVWNGCISKIAYYPKRLSNAEIQSITIS